jgi:predicted enzyme related to lactoylglutathione lyase
MSSPVVQWQIVTKDPEAASAFYANLLGWRIDTDNPLGYRVVDTGATEGIQGGIWPSPADGHNFVQLFIRVASVAESVARAEQLGARTIIPPQVLPEGDVLAIVQDPQGIPFGLMSDRPRS